ncbi:MAG: PilZ domain-containing protein [Acidobacteria bacterium]|nr:PilZ domain-containing protein [Acidobacteriota bacterium]
MPRPKRYRVALPLWVRIGKRLGRGKRAKEEPVLVEETITDNISTTGCYFRLSQPPPVGSCAEIEITVPPHYAGIQGGKVQCRGKVIRVETQPGKKAGVACTIESYDFSPPPEAKKRVHQ